MRVCFGTLADLMNIPNLRSPKDKMAGWVHLPRFVDKIRLHLAGKLPEDYQKNFGSGFDGYWIEASGVSKDALMEVVTKEGNDAAVEAWVKANVKKTVAEVEAFNRKVLNRGRNDDITPRLLERKKEAGLEKRDDIQTFVDFIDADEGRL